MRVIGNRSKWHIFTFILEKIIKDLSNMQPLTHNNPERSSPFYKKMTHTHINTPKATPSSTVHLTPQHQISKLHAHNLNQLVPSKKPRTDMRGSKASTLMDSSMRQSTMSVDTTNEEGYVEHLRNILIQLEDTTSFLQSKREKSRRKFQESLDKIYGDRDGLRVKEQ